jgi:hypothetical protein
LAVGIGDRSDSKGAMSCARSSLGKIFNWSHWLYTKVLFNAISDVLLVGLI